MAHSTHDEPAGMPITVTATTSVIDDILAMQSETEASGAPGVQEIEPDLHEFSMALGRSY
jgi:hypothetical protein